MSPARRVTRGFNIDGDDGQEGSGPPPRRVRTRTQILNGEGKRPPASVELKLLAHNPFNPREELTEIEETADSLREKGQLQPLAVVRRAAFLTVHPDQEGALGEAEYVVIDGNRRLAGARMAGLQELRIDVNDALAESASDILEAALIANVHRVDVPPLDQAKALQELVGVHGSQGKVAKRLGKTAAWVSQRLALLELTPELQKEVESGDLKVEPARRIGRLPKPEQKQAAAAAKTAPRPRRSTGQDRKESGDSQTVNAVNTPDGAPGSTSSEAATVNGVNTHEAQLPDERSPGSAAPGPEATDDDPYVLPWGDPEALCELLVRRMTHSNRIELTKLLLNVNSEG